MTGIVLILERTGEVDGMGMVGNLYVDGTLYGKTMEQNWQNNEPFKSCLPAGSYILEPYDSPKYGRTVALSNHDDVRANQSELPNGKGRYACLIHTANWASELQGCIAIGKTHACGQKNRWLPDALMVTASRATVDKLIDLIYERGDGIISIHHKQY